MYIEDLKKRFRIEYKFFTVKEEETADGATLQEMYYHFATTDVLKYKKDVNAKLKQLQERGDVIDAWITEAYYADFKNPMVKK